MISVCICTYNGERFIEEQLEYIRKQTIMPDEVVICDDASADGTVKVISDYIERHKLAHWRLIVNEKNRGYPANFYFCMGECKGDIVFPADQDDIWEPEKIEKMQRIMKAYPQIQVLSCCYGIVDEEGKSLRGILAPKEVNTGAVHPVAVDEVLYKDCWAGMTLAYRNSFYEKIREQVQESDLPHDRALWTLAADENGFYQLDETLAYHRRHSRNTCNEEHRVGKLMRYERKLQEIQVYMGYMQGFLQEGVEMTSRSKEEIADKLKQLQIRYDNLKNRRIGAILKNYCNNRKKVRAVTMLCDLGIVLLRR